MNSDKAEKSKSILVVSLDFEMYWGMADYADIKSWAPIMERVYKVVPELLRIFERHGIHSTWATVGALMAKNDEEFLEYLPKPVSSQTDAILRKLGIWPVKDESQCPRNILFAPELVEMIAKTPGQEIGTHTYSHYYCDKPTSKIDDFSGEIKAACAIAKKNGYDIKTIVFPRNQISDEYVDVIADTGIIAYRGNEHSWINKLKGKIKTLVWYADNYLPIAKFGYQLKEVKAKDKYNVKKSRFFKPRMFKYKVLEPFKLLRYKHEMRSAAKRGEVYHMCWHPHNFATFSKENFVQIEKLFCYYDKLCRKYGMKSLNMVEVTEEYNKYFRETREQL